MSEKENLELLINKIIRYQNTKFKNKKIQRNFQRNITSSIKKNLDISKEEAMNFELCLTLLKDKLQSLKYSLNDKKDLLPFYLMWVNDIVVDEDFYEALKYLTIYFHTSNWPILIDKIIEFKKNIKDKILLKDISARMAIERCFIDLDNILIAKEFMANFEEYENNWLEVLKYFENLANIEKEKTMTLERFNYEYR